jgi:hypothetical protein
LYKGRLLAAALLAPLFACPVVAQHCADEVGIKARAASPPNQKDKKNYAEYQMHAAKYKTDTDNAILNTLNAMVADPPNLTGDIESRKRQWKEWWAKNKDTAQFVKPPATAHE